jgi:hypothetical protein
VHCNVGVSLLMLSDVVCVAGGRCQVFVQPSEDSFTIATVREDFSCSMWYLCDFTPLVCCPCEVP